MKKTLKEFKKVENLEGVEENFKRLYWIVLREYEHGLKWEDNGLMKEAIREMGIFAETYVQIMFGVCIYKGEYLEQCDIKAYVDMKHKVEEKWTNEYREYLRKGTQNDC